MNGSSCGTGEYGWSNLKKIYSKKKSRGTCLGQHWLATYFLRAPRRCRHIGLSTGGRFSKAKRFKSSKKKKKGFLIKEPNCTGETYSSPLPDSFKTELDLIIQWLLLWTDSSQSYHNLSMMISQFWMTNWVSNEILIALNLEVICSPSHLLLWGLVFFNINSKQVKCKQKKWMEEISGKMQQMMMSREAKMNPAVKLSHQKNPAVKLSRANLTRKRIDYRRRMLGRICSSKFISIVVVRQNVQDFLNFDENLEVERHEVRCKDEETFFRIKDDGPWQARGYLVAMTVIPRDGFTFYTKAIIMEERFWVQLKNISAEYLTEETLVKITEKLPFLLCDSCRVLDHNDKKCIEEQKVVSLHLQKGNDPDSNIGPRNEEKEIYEGEAANKGLVIRFAPTPPSFSENNATGHQHNFVRQRNVIPRAWHPTLGSSSSARNNDNGNKDKGKGILVGTSPPVTTLNDHHPGFTSVPRISSKFSNLDPTLFASPPFNKELVLPNLPSIITNQVGLVENNTAEVQSENGLEILGMGQEFQHKDPKSPKTTIIVRDDLISVANPVNSQNISSDLSNTLEAFIQASTGSQLDLPNFGSSEEFSKINSSENNTGKVIEDNILHDSEQGEGEHKRKQTMTIEAEEEDLEEYLPLKKRKNSIQLQINEATSFCV